MPSSTLDPTVTITFIPSSGAHILGSNPLLRYRGLANEFRETHPHIQIRLSESYQGRSATMEDAAEQSDCFAWTPRLGSPADMSVVLSLQPFLDADPTYPIDDFYPSLLAQFTWEGQLRALPIQAEPYVIHYNKDLFDRKGLGYPAVDWTLDQFLETAISLTRGGGETKQYGFAAAPTEFQELAWVLERHGAKVMDVDADPPTVHFDAPATIEALRWYVSLSTVHEVKPVFVTDWSELQDIAAATERWETMIRENRAAMWTTMEGENLVYDPEGMDVGFAVLPAGTDGAAGAYRTVTGYFISAQTEARQACWDWIDFLTTQPKIIWGAPSRRSVLQSETYQQRGGADRAAVYEASVGGVDRPPTFAVSAENEWLFWGEIMWLARAYGEVIRGEASVEDALARAQETFTVYRTCVVLGEAMLDDREVSNCLLEADPTLPIGLDED